MSRILRCNPSGRHLTAGNTGRNANRNANRKGTEMYALATFIIVGIPAALVIAALIIDDLT